MLQDLTYWGRAMDRRLLANDLYWKLEGRVAGGPFKGMLLSGAQPWDDGNLGSKMLGTYEAQLHTWVSAIIDSCPARIINVGCAEGYYAVGFGNAAPMAEIVAVDASADCQRACLQNADLNEVPIMMGGPVTPGLLAALIVENSVIIMDCEGAEEELVQPQHYGQFTNCDLLIECHDFMRDGSISETLAARLRHSHEVTLLRDEITDVAAHADALRHPALAGYLPEEKAALVHEERPEGTVWLLAERRR